MSFAWVKARIEAACARCGRDPSEVTLVGVAKGHGAEQVQSVLLANGVFDVGENRVQEWHEKAPKLPPEVRWHFVGALQRNKVKYLADGKVALVHSLNSARLADEMDGQGGKRGHRFRALIEVDVAGEPSKQGLPVDEVPELLDHCRGRSHLEVVGLMAMAPYSDDPERARPYFRSLRELADRLGLPERSMGMSGDFEVAIEEGATLIRVGTSLFAPEVERSKA